MIESPSCFNSYASYNARRRKVLLTSSWGWCLTVAAHLVRAVVQSETLLKNATPPRLRTISDLPGTPRPFFRSGVALRSNLWTPRRTLLWPALHVIKWLIPAFDKSSLSHYSLVRYNVCLIDSVSNLGHQNIITALSARHSFLIPFKFHSAEFSFEWCRKWNDAESETSKKLKLNVGFEHGNFGPLHYELCHLNATLI